MRIDKLAPLSKVELRFDGKDEVEPAIFIRTHGEGEDRKAEFVSLNYGGDDYSWSAYRMDGSWRYGSSGGRLSLVRVVG